jgi:Xaa-Pro dipeptidase
MSMHGQEEFQRRLKRVRDAMRERGLETLLVYDGGRHNFLRMNYVAYLSDFIGVGPRTILVIGLDEEPVLYISPAWDIPRAQEESWVRDVRPFKEFWSWATTAKAAAGLVGRDYMDVRMHDELANTLNRTPVDAQGIVEHLARCKSPFELERLRKAAEIADAGVAALHNEARPGLKEFELAAIVEHRMRSLGAEDNFGMVVAHSHNQALHPATDRIVQRGDIIIGEITPCIGGLFVQICRTLVLGEPSLVLSEKYAILRQAMVLAMEAAKTGALASDIAVAINRAFIEAGYADYCRPPFMRVRGHGLGCGSFAPGSLEEGNKTELAEGMTFIIHPNQYIPETGYLTLGDTVVMTEAKAESLMRSSWEMFIKE